MRHTPRKAGDCRGLGADAANAAQAAAGVAHDPRAPRPATQSPRGALSAMPAAPGRGAQASPPQARFGGAARSPAHVAGQRPAVTCASDDGMEGLYMRSMALWQTNVALRQQLGALAAHALALHSALASTPRVQPPAARSQPAVPHGLPPRAGAVGSGQLGHVLGAPVVPPPGVGVGGLFAPAMPLPAGPPLQLQLPARTMLSVSAAGGSPAHSTVHPVAAGVRQADVGPALRPGAASVPTICALPPVTAAAPGVEQPFVLVPVVGAGLPRRPHGHMRRPRVHQPRYKQGKLEAWELQRVSSFVDKVKSGEVTVERGTLAARLREYVNPDRLQVFYEKLVSRRRLNQELAGLLTPRHSHKRTVGGSSCAAPSDQRTSKRARRQAASAGASVRAQATAALPPPDTAASGDGTDRAPRRHGGAGGTGGHHQHRRVDGTAQTSTAGDPPRAAESRVKRRRSASVSPPDGAQPCSPVVDVVGPGPGDGRQEADSGGDVGSRAANGGYA